MSERLKPIGRLIVVLSVFLSLCSLFASSSMYAIYGSFVSAVESKYSWVVTLVPWVLIPLIIFSFVYLCWSKSFKVKMLCSLFMVFGSIIVGETPGKVYNGAVRELKVKNTVDFEEIEALEAEFGFKCYQYSMSGKGDLVIYAKENYSAEFEERLQSHLRN